MAEETVGPDITGDGKQDLDITDAGDFGTIGGAIFGDAANVGSGTGNYNTFLSLHDDPNDPDEIEIGFNAGQSGGGAKANPEDSTNSEMGDSTSSAILLGAIPIIIVNGIAYYEFRVDLNENNSGTDPLVSLDQFQLFVGPYDLDTDPPNPVPSTSGQNDPNIDLVDTFAEVQALTKVYDMDAGGDVSVLMDEFASSGSGTDDYSVLVPVSNFAGLDPATTYVYLFVQMGAADPDPDDTSNNVWGVSGGFHEWNLQNAVIIQGQKFNDINGDGDQDAGEGGVEGVTIYIDDNLNGVVDPTDNNGIFDELAGEQSDVTDINGNYSFGGIPVLDADYTINIREVVPDGSVPTTDLPVEVVIDSSLAAGTIITTTTVPGLLIGNHLLSPSISLTKSASVPGDCANVVGELISYSVVVDNDGELALTNVVLTDNFEGGGNVTLTPSDDGDGILELGEVFLSGDTGNDGIMGVDETWTYTYLRAVTQAQIDSNGGGNGTLTDVATVNADSANGSVTDNDDASVAVCQEPALSIDKSATVPGDCANTVGELISYSVVLDNIGNVALDNVVLEDNFEGGGNVTLTPSDDGDGILELGEVFLSGDTGNDGIMGVDETWTYTYLRAVTQEDIDSNGYGDGDLDNTATANADAVNSDEAADEVTDDASVAVCQEPALSIDKSATVPGDCANTVGELISYSVVLDNIGNVALDNVVLEDNFEGGGNVTLTPSDDGDGILELGEVFLSGDTGNDGIMGVDETWTYTYLRAVTQEDIDSNGYGDGDLDNTATANADAVNSDEAADEVTDDASVAVCQEPAITIEKSVKTNINNVYADADDPDGLQASTSTTVDFRVVVTNTGNVTLTNVTLADTVDHDGAETNEVLDYTTLNAQVDIDNDGIIDGNWSDFDTDGDGTIDDADGNAATVDDFELGVGDSFAIYYSLDSALGQHENTAVVTADAATTGTDVTAEDDANYYVLPSEDCVGVRTPGFWSNPKWMTFWDGVADNEPAAQAGTPGFADGELLYVVDSNNDGVVDGSDAKGLLVGDYDKDGITDLGLDGIANTGDAGEEDTIFIGYNDAVKLINASSKQIGGDGKTSDGIYMLGRDMVATWLNYLANNQETIGECIDLPDPNNEFNSPREYLDAAIDWMQQFASDVNGGSVNHNLANSYHDDVDQAMFRFDSRVAPSSAAWQTAYTGEAGTGDNIPFSAAQMHAQLDAYNNTGVINGIEYCCDADNQLALIALTQVSLI